MYNIIYKQKIRTLFLLGKFGSDFSGLVPVTGLDSRPAALGHSRLSMSTGHLFTTAPTSSPD